MPRSLPGITTALEDSAECECGQCRFYRADVSWLTRQLKEASHRADQLKADNRRLLRRLRKLRHKRH